jgi:hypothetical protein
MTVCDVDPTITVVLSWPDPVDPAVTVTFEIPPECDDSGCWWNSLAFPEFDFRYGYAPPSSWIPGDILLSVVGEAAPLPLVIGVRGTDLDDLKAQKAAVAAALRVEDLTVTLVATPDTGPDVILAEYEAQPAKPKWGPITPQLMGVLAAEGIVSIPCNPPEEDEPALIIPDLGQPKGPDGPPPDEDPEGDDTGGSDTPVVPGDKVGLPDPGTLYLGASNLQAGQEAGWGHRIGVHRTFWNDSTSSTNSAVAQVQADADAGRVSHLSFKIGATWDAAAGGARDAWLLNLCTRLQATGGVIYLTIHHEPNSASEISANGGMSRYKAMYTHMKVAVTDDFPNVWLVPVISAGYWQISGGGGWHLADWMSTASSDAFGIDAYNPYSVLQSGSHFLTVDQVFRLGGVAEALAIDADMPIVVGEWAVRDKAGVDVAQWMEDAFDYCRTHNVISLSYFNSNRNSPDGSWELTRTAAGVIEHPAPRDDKFQELLNGPDAAYIPLGGP